MKAIRIHDYGDASALKYEDAPAPEHTPDGVLIKVHALASIQSIGKSARG